MNGRLTFKILETKIVLRNNDRICESAEEIIASDLFKEILKRAIAKLANRRSFLLNIFGKKDVADSDIDLLIQVLKALTKTSGRSVPSVVKNSEVFFKDLNVFNEFVEYVYNYWRSYDRFVISNATEKDFDRGPNRIFNDTIGQLTTLIRGLYRDIQSNITGKHPRIYRQVAAGAEVSTIATIKKIKFSAPIYEKLNVVPIVRQMLIYPPLILNPPMNKRTGKFERVNRNPLELFDLNNSEWLCYPAKVGPLLIMIYFHNQFAELGHALCNLFQLAEDEDLERKPDAVYAFGVPANCLDGLGNFPTVFYDDKENDILVGAVPCRDEFGYFGYLKKMVLTLHNIVMMKRGMLPFHGALIRVILRGNKDKTILFMGDTGAGKSETLEAFREIGDEEIQDLVIIADDMGSLDIDKNGNIIGYGTEIGAFLRLDDLKPGYALGQIDRAIIMSPNQVNARIILPVTSFDNVMAGHKIDYIMYANNYDDIDDDHPIIERFDNVEKALNVFREGMVMSKGTTTTTGIVHSYFANVFGPPQYKDLHEPLAQKFFQAFFKSGGFIGQMRTRLGLSGWERTGPLEASKVLLKIMSENN